MTVTDLRISAEEKTAELAELLGYDAGSFNDLVNGDEMGFDAVRQRMIKEAWNIPTRTLGDLTPEALKRIQVLRVELART